MNRRALLRLIPLGLAAPFAAPLAKLAPERDAILDAFLKAGARVVPYSRGTGNGFDAYVQNANGAIVGFIESGTSRFWPITTSWPSADWSGWANGVRK